MSNQGMQFICIQNGCVLSKQFLPYLDSFGHFGSGSQEIVAQKNKKSHGTTISGFGQVVNRDFGFRLSHVLLSERLSKLFLMS